LDFSSSGPPNVDTDSILSRKFELRAPM
jgi:hypothetical protein